MRSSSRSDEYCSTKSIESTTCPGVRFQIRRVSIAGRIELLRRVRGLWNQLRFHQAGEEVEDKLTEAEVSAELLRVYLEWGLTGIENLSIDGEAAGVPLLNERGPEQLCREIAQAIVSECSLTEDERKNSGSPSIT